jgi:tRNA-specific 2-thiouridylase
VVDAAGHELGAVDAVELVTVGQRRGLGLPGGGDARYVTAVDVPRRRVTVGPAADLEVGEVRLDSMVWAAGPVAGPVNAQCSAHGAPRPARVAPGGASATVVFDRPERRVAVGQSVVLYDPATDQVLGGGLAAP